MPEMLRKVSPGRREHLPAAHLSVPLLITVWSNLLAAAIKRLGTSSTSQVMEQTTPAARKRGRAKGVTINGLTILSEIPLPTNPLHTNPPRGLTAYYENNVIGGPGAFVVEAQSFEAFGQLLIGKLIKEIAEAPRRRL